MAERHIPDLDRERMLTPEYWDGHMLDDDCPVELVKPRSSTDFLKVMVKHEPILRSSWEVIAQRIGLETMPTRRFKRGEVFVGSEYPLGTVIRFDREFLSQKGGKAKIIPPHINYGLTVQDEGGLIKLVNFTEMAMRTKSKNYGVISDAEILVGEVVHKRSVSGKHSSNGLQRTKFLEILGVGSGATQAIGQKSGLEKLVFAPQGA